MNWQRLTFFFLILFLPTQLGRHFWFDFSYVLGQRVDYLSPTIYLTDILIGILFLLAGKKVWEVLKKNALLFLLSCCLAVLLSIFWVVFQNQEPGLLLYKWLKLFELLFFIWWVKSYASLRAVLLPLNFSLLFASLLAWLQFFYQRSLGFWFLGERTFHSGTPGIALAKWRGSLILRPYATFPHPNVLAGYTLIILILNLFSIRQRPFWQNLVLFLGTATIFISFSRTVWLTWALMLAFWLWRNKKK